MRGRSRLGRTTGCCARSPARAFSARMFSESWTVGSGRWSQGRLLMHRGLGPLSSLVRPRALEKFFGGDGLPIAPPAAPPQSPVPSTAGDPDLGVRGVLSRLLQGWNERVETGPVSRITRGGLFEEGSREPLLLHHHASILCAALWRMLRSTRRRVMPRSVGCFGSLLAGPQYTLFVLSNVVNFPKPR